MSTPKVLAPATPHRRHHMGRGSFLAQTDVTERFCELAAIALVMAAVVSLNWIDMPSDAEMLFAYFFSAMLIGILVDISCGGPPRENAPCHSSPD